MRTIESVLGSGKTFIIDEIACMQHAKIISEYSRPSESFPWSSYSPEFVLAFKVAFISICHQFNWDFLQLALWKNLPHDEDAFINNLVNMRAPTISNWLGNYHKPQRIRAKERAAILRDVGNIFREEYNSNLNSFFASCENATLKNGEFHQILDKFLGFRTDPLRKKTNVLSHDLYREEIIGFKDEEHIEPAVDYHIMRLYLRTGRVVASDPSVLEFLGENPKPRGTLVRMLRETVSEAEKLVAFYAGLNVSDVNYIEWQIGRAVCLNTNPLCTNLKIRDNLPDDLQFFGEKGCPYFRVCTASRNEIFVGLQEPNVTSTDY